MIKNSRYDFRLKLILIMVVPMMGMIYFGVSSLKSKYNYYVEFKRIVDLSELAMLSSEFIYRLQRERKYGVLYLVSHAEQYQQEYLTTSNDTDGVGAKLGEIIERVVEQDRSINTDQEFEGVLGWASGQIAEVPYLREKIVKKANAKKESRFIPTIVTYREINAVIFDVVAAAVRRSKHHEVVAVASTYLNHLLIQEMFSDEQSLVLGLLWRKKTEKGAYRELIEVLNNQKTYRKVFDSFASTQQIAFLNKRVVDESYFDLLRVRDVLIGGDEITLPQMTVEEYLTLSNAYNKNMLVVNQKLANDFKGTVTKLQGMYRLRLMYEVGFIFVSLVTVTFFFFAILRLVSLHLERKSLERVP